MDETNEKVKEIINLVKEKDSTYKSKALELIENLQNLEKKKETAETQLTAILLNFILENYSQTEIIEFVKTPDLLRKVEYIIFEKALNISLFCIKFLYLSAIINLIWSSLPISIFSVLASSRNSTIKLCIILLHLKE